MSIQRMAVVVIVLSILTATGIHAQWPQPQPPVNPEVRLVSGSNSITIHFNGLVPEAIPDTVTGVVDFEGYRIYMSYQSGTNADLELIEQYDLEDYNKYVWRYGLSVWELRDNPYSLEELRCAYGAGCDDSTFDPLIYTPASPYVVSGTFDDSLFYFERVFENLASLEAPGIHKRFPDQPYPTSFDPALALPPELTADGYLKYFDYEYVCNNVMGGVDVWVSVTTMDFGVYQIVMPPSESDPSATAQLLSVPGNCCIGMRGNFVVQPAEETVLTGPVDLAILVDFLFSDGAGAQCDAEGDVNADGAVGNPVDLAHLVDYLYAGGAAPAACP